jgi:hypothetical protein
MEFGPAYCKDFLKRNPKKFIFHFRSFILFPMIFRSFTHFLGILSIHFRNFGKGKSFLAYGSAFGPRSRRAGLVQRWIRPGQDMPAGVVRRARRGHRACEAQGGAPTDSSPAARVWCPELLEHHLRVAYPPGKATRRGALWRGGSTRGGRNLPAAVAFVEKSDEEVD